MAWRNIHIQRFKCNFIKIAFIKIILNSFSIGKVKFQEESMSENYRNLSVSGLLNGH